MKNKIKELMVITTNSKTVEDFKKNFKKGYLELLDFDEINRLNKEEDRLYNSIDKVINGKIYDLSYMVTKFDPCGYKDSKEIINKIKELLQSWLPF